MPTEILMPALSPTMEEGKLAKWLVKEGQTIKPGDIIAEIETDKATMEVEAVDEGKVSKLLVAEGTEGVKVNAPIAVLLAEGEKDGAPTVAKAPSAPAALQRTSPLPPCGGGPQGWVADQPLACSPHPEALPTRGRGSTCGRGAREPAPAPNGHARIAASPLARRLARAAGLELAALAGSGPHGRIVKRDIEAAVRDGVGQAQAKAGTAMTKAPSTRPRRSASSRCPTTRSWRSTRRAPTRSCRTTACARSSPSA